MLHAVYGQNNAGEARRDMGEEVDGAVGGSKEKKSEEGTPLLPCFPHTEPLSAFDFCSH